MPAMPIFVGDDLEGSKSCGGNAQPIMNFLNTIRYVTLLKDAIALPSALIASSSAKMQALNVQLQLLQDQRQTLVTQINAITANANAQKQTTYNQQGEIINTLKSMIDALSDVLQAQQSATIIIQASAQKSPLGQVCQQLRGVIAQTKALAQTQIAANASQTDQIAALNAKVQQLNQQMMQNGKTIASAAPANAPKGRLLFPGLIPNYQHAMATSQQQMSAFINDLQTKNQVIQDSINAANTLLAQANAISASIKLLDSQMAAINEETNRLNDYINKTLSPFIEQLKTAIESASQQIKAFDTGLFKSCPNYAVTMLKKIS